MENIDTRPETVSKAIKLLYAVIIIGIVRGIIVFPKMVEMSAELGGAKFVILVQGFTLGILWLLAFLIGKRKNWARYIFTALFVIGLRFSIEPIFKSLANEPALGLMDLTQTVAQAMSVVLLFKAPSREWFKKRSM